MDAVGDECIDVPITEEVMYLTVYYDSLDVEGIIF